MPATPARIAGFLGSWTQTQYRLGDVNISSPTDGTPLLFPDLAFWDRMDIMTGALAADTAHQALAVTLQPRRPSPNGTGMIEASTSRGRLIASPPPSGARRRSCASPRPMGSRRAIATGPSSIPPRVALAVGGILDAQHDVRACGAPPTLGQRLDRRSR